MIALAHQPIPTPVPDQAERMPYLVTIVPRSDSLVPYPRHRTVPPPPPSYPRNMSTRTPCHVREQHQQLLSSGPVVHARPNSFTTSKLVADVYSYEYEIATLAAPSILGAQLRSITDSLWSRSTTTITFRHNRQECSPRCSLFQKILDSQTVVRRHLGRVHYRPRLPQISDVEVWDEPSLDRSGGQLRALGRVSELHGAAVDAG
jgi:hypothetical protein